MIRVWQPVAPNKNRGLWFVFVVMVGLPARGVGVLGGEDKARAGES